MVVLGIIDSNIVKKIAWNIIWYHLSAHWYEDWSYLILLWKHTKLLRDIFKYLELEKIKFSFTKQERKFYRIWQPFIDHFNHTNQSFHKSQSGLLSGLLDPGNKDKEYFKEQSSATSFSFSFFLSCGGIIVYTIKVEGSYTLVKSAMSNVFSNDW